VRRSGWRQGTGAGRRANDVGDAHLGGQDFTAGACDRGWMDQRTGHPAAASEGVAPALVLRQDQAIDA